MALDDEEKNMLAIVTFLLVVGFSGVFGLCYLIVYYPNMAIGLGLLTTLCLFGWSCHFLLKTKKRTGKWVDF